LFEDWSNVRKSETIRETEAKKKECLFIMLKLFENEEG